ncbi:MAG: hypothetical protein FRX49_06612 [Trebouxia sp. A1-2]|nr:MAG: hypothetical protein FRX49_06612 [Trebouxia sp. A1-2]
MTGPTSVPGSWPADTFRSLALLRRASLYLPMPPTKTAAEMAIHRCPAAPMDAPTRAEAVASGYNDAGKQTSSNKAVWDQHEMTQQLTATSSLILKTVRGSVLRTRKRILGRLDSLFKLFVCDDGHSAHHFLCSLHV